MDSLRGVAILLVLFFHGMAPVKNAQLSYAGNMILSVSQRGWSGVNLFFVLSGFLITGILADSRDRQDYYRRFYIRRGLRILPALYAILLLLLVGGWIQWRFLLLSLLFLANSAPLLGVALQYGPLWSLAVEEHFYIVWPTLIRRLSSRRLILIALLRCSTRKNPGGPLRGDGHRHHRQKHGQPDASRSKVEGSRVGAEDSHE